MYSLIDWLIRIFTNFSFNDFSLAFFYFLTWQTLLLKIQTWYQSLTWQSLAQNALSYSFVIHIKLDQNNFILGHTQVLVPIKGNN